MSDQYGTIIYSYTRKQALEDGVLIDVSEEAKSAGFKIPVAVGDNLFHRYVIPPEGLSKEGQSMEGRLHDLFEMLKAAASMRWKDSKVLFDVLFLMAPGKLEQVRILAVAGPGDEGEPVLTICLPEDE